MHQLVFGGAEPGMAGGGAPAGTVDQHLGMFDAHTHGKGLGLQGHPLLLQRSKQIAGAVPGGQHHMARGDLLAVGQLDAGDLAVAGVQQHPHDPALKTHPTAQGFDAAAQPAHHGGQLEGADVGVVEGEDLGVGTRGHQFFEHFALVGRRLTHLAVELAVRKGAGAPLPELGIGFRIKGPGAAPETEGVGRAALDIATPLEQHRPQAHLGQQQSRKVAAGTRPHHHGARGVGLRQVRRNQRLQWGPITGVGGGLQVGVPGGQACEASVQGRGAVELHIDAVHQLNRSAAAGIDAAAHHLPASQLDRVKPQAPAEQRLELSVRVVEGEFELVNPPEVPLHNALSMLSIHFSSPHPRRCTVRLTAPTVVPCR